MNRIFYTIIILVALVCFATKALNAQDAISWKFKTGNGINAAPLVIDTVVYVGSNDTYFYAVNKNTGKEIWKFKTSFAINSKATTNDSLVFIESGFKLYALDRKTGSEVWSFVANTGVPEMQVGFTDYHHCSPAIYKNRVYFGDGWGNMNGVEIQTGSLKFQYTITGDSAAIRSTPAFNNDTIYFGTWAGNAYAIKLADSTLVWKYSLPGRKENYGMITSEMVIKNNILYFGSQHDVYTPIDINTGKAAWKFIDPNQTYLPSGPAFYNDAVIVGTTVNTYKIYSLTNGNINWTFNTDGIFFITPVIVDTVLIMNTSSFGGTGTMYFVDVRNGAFINEYHFYNAAPSSPAVSDDKLYVGNGDGYLYAFYLNRLIHITDDTTITIDTATEEYKLTDTNEITTISIEINNKANICDDYIFTKTMSNNTPENGIANLTSNTGHIWANTSINTPVFRVYPMRLTAGTYKLEILVSSKKFPENKFYKTINVIMEQASSTELAATDEFLVNFYPNPAKEFITIEITNYTKPVQLTIYSISGQMVYNEMLVNTKTNWNITDFKGRKCKAGEYIYRINSKNGELSGILSVL